jgi:hypothetical protein
MNPHREVRFRDTATLGGRDTKRGFVWPADQPTTPHLRIVLVLRFALPEVSRRKLGFSSVLSVELNGTARPTIRLPEPCLPGPARPSVSRAVS